MGFDAQIKRFYPLILCTLIAVVAYLQASGITQLLGATVAGSGHVTPATITAPPGGNAPQLTSGRAILQRNPFDSVTGPIGAGSQVASADDGGDEGDEPAGEAVVGGDPFEDPDCAFGRVVLISESEDPEWSFAAIEDNSGSSHLRRRGDEVNDHTVQFVAWDRVWLASSGQRCQLKLGEKKAAAKKPPTKKGSSKRPARSKRRSRQIDPAMAAKIHKVSDTEFNVERSVVDDILENQAQLMRSARIVPEKDGDKVVGIRMFGIRKGTLLNHLGMQNGDRLESINGFPMSDPQKALEAYGRLRTASSLKVQINRKGTPTTLDFNIQ
jgi:general secretion pathway protein C